MIVRTTLKAIFFFFGARDAFKCVVCVHVRLHVACVDFSAWESLSLPLLGLEATHLTLSLSPPSLLL